MVKEKLPRQRRRRHKGSKYLHNGLVTIWDGKRLRCEHNHRRSQCKECGGASICEHKRIRSKCKECGGALICEHKRIRSQCTEDSCGLIPSSSKCPICCSKLVKRNRYDPLSAYCSGCRCGVPTRIRRFELKMENLLNSSGLHWSYRDKKLPCAPTTRYPDFMFVASNEHVVLLEVDENQHRSYDVGCEVARLSEIMDSIDFMNMHVVRYNPHSDVSEVRLINVIQEAIFANRGIDSECGCVVQYLGYSDERVFELEKAYRLLQAPKL